MDLEIIYMPNILNSPSIFFFHLTANLKNWFISYKSCILNCVSTGKLSGWWLQRCWSWLLFWDCTIPITLVWNRLMSPLGDPLAPQPRETPGGAQDSSMSSLQSSRKPDIQLVPRPSIQPTSLSPSIVLQSQGVATLLPARQGISRGSLTLSTSVGTIYTQ